MTKLEEGISAFCGPHSDTVLRLLAVLEATRKLDIYHQSWCAIRKVPGGDVLLVDSACSCGVTALVLAQNACEADPLLAPIAPMQPPKEE